MADQVVTVKEIRLGRIHRIVWTWKSATGGGASLVSNHAYNGKITLLTTDPGSPAPDPNYDLTVTDSPDGVDVLAGGGANRHTSTTEQVLGTSLGAVATSVLTMNITNANDEKAGVVYLDIDTSVA